MISLNINGQPTPFAGDPDTPLLWVLRDHCQLTGAKFGCGQGICGACTVHADGNAVRSCELTAATAAPHDITTIEGFVASSPHHAILRAWQELDVVQCGYCQPGMIMAVAALLESNPHPTDADIDQHITNICPCATFHRVRQAIHVAAACER